MGDDVKIASLQDQVRAIFELTRLHRIFEIFDDTEAAVKSFWKRIAEVWICALPQIGKEIDP